MALMPLVTPGPAVSTTKPGDLVSRAVASAANTADCSCLTSRICIGGAALSPPSSNRETRRRGGAGVGGRRGGGAAPGGRGGGGAGAPAAPARLKGGGGWLFRRHGRDV